MKKEVFLAILVGFVIGLIITFGVWQANKAIKSSSTLPKTSEIDQSLSPTPEANKSSLTILAPADELLSKLPTVTVKGIYLPGAQIVIIYEKGEKLLKADNNGNFEIEIGLVTGENQIEINGFTKEGDEAKQTITVVYTTVDI